MTDKEKFDLESVLLNVTWVTFAIIYVLLFIGTGKSVVRRAASVCRVLSES